MRDDEQFNRIMEAVNQGIVASKQSDSNFWGEMKVWQAKKDLRDEKVHDDILGIKNEVVALNGKVGIQNGRVTKSEGKIESFDKDRNWIKGAITGMGILLITCSTLIVYIFNLRFNQVELQYKTLSASVADVIKK